LLPQAAVGQERGGVVGAERGVDVEQGAKGPVLVVALIRLRELGGQVGGQEAGVGGGGESRQREAVALACVGGLAVQEQFADPVAELFALVQSDQPRGGEPGTP